MSLNSSPINLFHVFLRLALAHLLCSLPLLISLSSSSPASDLALDEDGTLRVSHPFILESNFIHKHYLKFSSSPAHTSSSPSPPGDHPALVAKFFI
jgi:hypothetical protein